MLSFLLTSLHPSSILIPLSLSYSLIAFQIFFPNLGVKTSMSKWRTCCSHLEEQMREVIARNPGTHGLEGKQRHWRTFALLGQTLCLVCKEPAWGAVRVTFSMPGVQTYMGLPFSVWDGELVWAPPCMIAYAESTHYLFSFFSFLLSFPLVTLGTFVNLSEACFLFYDVSGTHLLGLLED